MSELFKQAVADTGVPTSQDQLNAQWQTIVAESGSQISNDSAYSPFWRVVTALVTKPVLYLVNTVLVEKLIPQFFLKTVGGQLLDSWAANHRVTRKAAAKATGHVVFSRADKDGDIVIPAGTLVSTNDINGKTFVLQTNAAATLLSANSTTTVAVRATLAGAGHNLNANAYTQMPTPIAGLSVANTDQWQTALGADEETNEALRHRVRVGFNTLSHYHIDGVYRAIISEFGGVDSRNIWFKHDAPRGPGTANAYVLLPDSENHTAIFTAINAHIKSGYHGHGDDLLVLSMPRSQHSITATLWLAAGLLDSQQNQITATATALIKAAFRQGVRSQVITLAAPFSRFSLSRLGTELHTQIDGLTSIEFNQGDIISSWAVPNLATLTIEVGQDV